MPYDACNSPVICL